MKRYFFDTSALVKIYHREVGSDFCLDLCGTVSFDNLRKFSAVVEQEEVQAVFI